MFGRYSVFKWQFWRWRYRYWRKRAVKAEKLLTAETNRNREREDELATAPIRLGGLFAPPPRVTQAPPIAQPVQSEGLSWADNQEFEMYWKPDAEAANIPVSQAMQKFRQELASRHLNDDPFN